jgi:cytochrome c-type biogenesis protein CcmH/NrfG
LPLFSILSGSILALLATSPGDEPAQNFGPVELECRVLTEARTVELKRWRVVLLRATGEPIGRTEVLGEGPARFKDLTPGMYIACVFGEHGRRKCSSLDLRTESTEEGQRFVLAIRAPSPSSRNGDLHGVSIWNLSVPDDAKAEHARANAAQRAGERKQALRHLERAVALYPEYVEAWNDRGAVEHLLGKYDTAINCFSRAVALDSNYYPAWVNLGGTLLVESRYEEALNAARHALELRPSEALANSLAGQSCFYLHRYDEARAYFLRVVTLDPAYAAGPYRYLAHIAFAERKIKEGMDHLRAHLKLHPNSPDAPSIERTIHNLSRQLSRHVPAQVPE